MELRQLLHFVAVAEERSFTRAARRANIVQSGISSSIASLERELGVDLFRRSRRVIEMTAAGRAFLSEARRAIAAIDAATTAARGADASLGGTLNLSIVGASPPQLQLAKVVRDYCRAHPDVAVKLYTVSLPNLDQVRTGAVDLALCPGKAPPGMTSIVVAESPLVLVVHESHCLANQRSVPISALAGESFIDLPPIFPLSRTVDHAFAKAGIERHRVIEASGWYIAVRLIQEGMGVCLLPETFARLSPQLRAIRVRPAVGSWELCASYLGDVPRNPTVLPFLEMLQATASPCCDRRNGCD